MRKVRLLTGGGGLEYSIDEFIYSLLEHIKALESKLDFSLIASYNEESQNFKSDFKRLSALLASLPTVPQNGWEKVRLRDYTIASGGNGFPKEYQGNKDSSQVPFIKVSDMNSLENQKEIVVSNNYVTQSVINELSLKIFPKNTIVFPKVGMAVYTNKKRILNIPCIIDNNIMGVNILDKKINELDYQFLFIIFDFCIDLKDMANNANPPSINNANLQNYKIPLPPLEIQEQILSIIEKIEENIALISQNIDSLNIAKTEVLKRLLET